MSDPESNTDVDIRDESPILHCSICGTVIMPELSGWTGGHNAEPINNGRCCSDCNSRTVVPARLQKMYEQRQK